MKTPVRYGAPYPRSVSLETGSGRTLRETVLESSPILALLNESFVSTWSLVKELEDLQVSRQVGGAAPWEPRGRTMLGAEVSERHPLSPQNKQDNPSHRKLASLHLEKYSFPVEMMICLPNGTVVGTLGLDCIGVPALPSFGSASIAFWLQSLKLVGKGL